jgi:flavin reductase (DIM6/NTAB) family NADH-FMN oxidoreductase RutF/pimeloyl-ACP methyl ester carboxylesterase
MTIAQFTGFAGIRLEAEVLGNDDDPAVLLVHGAGQTRAVWRDVALALVDAGRRAIILDLRGHGGSEWPADARYDLDAHVADLRAVLSQLGDRPVVVAASLGAWVAAAALERDAGLLAAGLVLVDMPARSDPEASERLGARLRQLSVEAGAAWDPRAIAGFPVDAVAERLLEAAPRLNLTTLFVRGGMARLDRSEDADAFVARLPDAERVDVEDAGLLVVGDRTDAFNAILLEFLERKQPRDQAEFRAGSDARTLRDALGCFATGVTVVTARTADGTPVGLTANSFTSVSLDPPLLLVCIANSAGSAGALREAEHFAVNVLQIGQQPVSNLFAGKGEDRFAGTGWSDGESGVPVLSGSLGSFECRRSAVHEGGDHFILVGEVTCARFEPRRDPLLYFRGKYRRLHFA